MHFAHRKREIHRKERKVTMKEKEMEVKGGRKKERRKVIQN